MTKGNTKRAERKTRQVYFTDAESPQVDAILAGENFNRWVRRKIAEEAKRKELPFNNNLPEKGKYERKRHED